VRVFRANEKGLKRQFADCFCHLNPNVAEKQSKMAFQGRLLRCETPIWVSSADLTLSEIWLKDANRDFAP